ncbi:FAD-dependent pyridine nucleotide-disulfide oxidoreductase [Caldalkalibacillus thermarum TA2.A1]|uniref:FAD-dependent pyridine nucleotide-disulfide oxidoreductase n=1 Tax=Caldalkalibacillus thermarum (strain TA2.A1) TaxID=986075 RepID=F5L7A5_CALTT|nr:YpdA family putative bacillithiol disulfide reductase [Caldalkalibacillus thermarum]EGL82766.1 FAD-dependent pyridine nucleotide-disulfide oxidoreductase [Caldalkalibacillus thermarum TA2.A1]QZT33913.1 YpdA family putative bacillithiol disulfide reductase [Caldalkalibacillus thermarum TA2.A1]
MREEVIIVGAGPCGLAAAIALQDKGFKPLIIEKGNVVDAIYRFPTHQTFFSTPEKLEIGDVPFIIQERKPSRSQALAYYREVARLKQLRINSYEKVEHITRQTDGSFLVESRRKHGERRSYSAPYVIVATGYYDHPNTLDVPGADLDKVFYYFKEAHPFYNQDVVVIGGKNSAVDATLQLEKAGARVTVLYRGKEFSQDVKPWVLPEFLSLIRHGKITMEFEAEVKEIRPDEVVYQVKGEQKTIKNDFVFAMIGYHPDHAFLTRIGVKIDQTTGRPQYDEQTMETNVPNLFVAGVIAAGNNANEIFIENGRFHGPKIAETIARRSRKGV